MKVTGVVAPQVIVVDEGASVKLIGTVSVITIFLIYTFPETLTNDEGIYASGRRFTAYDHSATSFYGTILPVTRGTKFWACV